MTKKMKLESQNKSALVNNLTKKPLELEAATCLFPEINCFTLLFTLPKVDRGGGGRWWVRANNAPLPVL